MKTLHFQKTINAHAEKVYRTMLGLDNIQTYEQWAGEFNPTSTYEGSWKKGAKIRFVGTGKDGKKGGMLSEIVENIPNKFVSVRHIGIVEEGTEITQGLIAEEWAGGLENYRFEENNGTITLRIETDTAEEYVEYFKESWPKGLEKLKELVES